MACFPLFIDLKERRCLVVGGGTVALRKIETLLRFDAAITVISPAAQPEIGRLAGAGRLIYRRKLKAGMPPVIFWQSPRLPFPKSTGWSARRRRA